jgi:hypothetical protein
MKKISFTKNPTPANRVDCMLLSEICFGMEFREFSSIFFSLRNGPERNTKSFLFRGMIQNGILRLCFNFRSMVQNSQFFLLCGMVWNGIPRVFCSSEQPEFRRNKQIFPSTPSSAE